MGALRLEQALASAWQSSPQKRNSGVDMSRMKNDLSRRRGMHAYALDDRTVAQRCLRPKSH